MTTYFYRVDEFVTDFQGNSFDCFEEFKSPKLLDARENAIAYRDKRIKGMGEKGELFGNPISGPPKDNPDFDARKHSAFSMVISLVEVTPEGEEIHYPIFGEDEQTVQESLEVEETVINSLYGEPEETD
jgi:hypothetical protein